MKTQSVETREIVRSWLALLGNVNALKKALDAELRESFGLSISRFDVLSALYRGGLKGLRPSELSSRLMVTEGNTTQVIGPLVEMGLVERVPSINDRRSVILKLTAKGRTVFEQMAEVHHGLLARAFRHLDADELADLHALCDAIDPDIRQHSESIA